MGGLKDGVVEVVVRPIAIKDAVCEGLRSGRAGKRREDRHLNQVHLQVIESLQCSPKYVRAVAIKAENDPRLDGDSMTMQELDRFAKARSNSEGPRARLVPLEEGIARRPMQGQGKTWARQTRPMGSPIHDAR